MAAETPSEFGDELRRDRELRHITREQLAATTRVSVRHIEALETGRWEGLPAKVFSRGFVRGIALHLGLDPERTAAGFGAVWDDWATGEKARRDQKARSSGELRAVKRRRGRPSPAALGLAVAALLAIATGVTVVLKPGVRARGAAATSGGDGASPAKGKPREATPVPLALPAAVAEATVPLPPSPGGPASTVPAGPDASGAPSEVSPASTLPAGAARVPGSGGMLLTLTFLDDCWTEVSVDGQVVAAELCRKGTRREFVGQARFTLTLENARNVSVSLDGRPVLTLSSDPGSSMVRNFVIDGATARRAATNG